MNAPKCYVYTFLACLVFKSVTLFFHYYVVNSTDQNPPLEADTHLINAFPTLQEAPRIHFRVHTRPTYDPILSLMDPTHTHAASQHYLPINAKSS